MHYRCIPDNEPQLECFFFGFIYSDYENHIDMGISCLPPNTLWPWMPWIGGPQSHAAPKEVPRRQAMDLRRAEDLGDWLQSHQL